MMGSIRKSSDIAEFATPEIRELFEEWVQEVDEEIMQYVKGKNSIDPDDIAKHLKISRKSAIYFISRLAQKGKINIKAEEGKEKENEKKE